MTRIIGWIRELTTQIRVSYTMWTVRINAGTSARPITPVPRTSAGCQDISWQLGPGSTDPVGARPRREQLQRKWGSSLAGSLAVNPGVNPAITLVSSPIAAMAYDAQPRFRLETAVFSSI